MTWYSHFSFWIAAPRGIEPRLLACSGCKAASPLIFVLRQKLTKAYSTA
tara:strand:+ start:33368 stop:33514 length:147 start_codon:yes stop_codon:yes gene_type:complete